MEAQDNFFEKHCQKFEEGQEEMTHECYSVYQEYVSIWDIAPFHLETKLLLSMFVTALFVDTHRLTLPLLVQFPQTKMLDSRIEDHLEQHVPGFKMSTFLQQIEYVPFPVEPPLSYLLLHAY